MNGYRHAWKDSQGKHREVFVGHAEGDSHVCIFFTIGKRNPKKTIVKLTPEAAMGLHECLTHLIYPTLK